MLFFHTRPSANCQPALRAAIAAHRPLVLRSLLARHGPRLFAKALADLSGRVIADALSMLRVADRDAVLGHLPRAARRRLHDVDAGYSNSPLNDPDAAYASRLFLVW